jgi:hypothetical protein
VIRRWRIGRVALGGLLLVRRWAGVRVEGLRGVVCGEVGEGGVELGRKL